MSLWSTLGKIGSVVAAPFTGGASLAIGAGLDLAGGLLQSHQASKAADAQKAAEQQALALQGQLYQQGYGGLAPFSQLGQSTLGNLYRMTGQQAPAAQAAPAMGLGQLGMGPGMPRTGPAVGTAQPRGAMVQLRAPDGSVGSVPADQVDHFISKGAVRL